MDVDLPDASDIPSPRDDGSGSGDEAENGGAHNASTRHRSAAPPGAAAAARTLAYVRNLRDKLKSDKVTKRREAHKDLADFLASGPSLAALDAATLAQHPSERVALGSWPALASAVIAALREDWKAAGAGAAASAGRRPPDPGPARSLKAVVTAAAAPGRWPGADAALAPRAGKLLDFLVDALPTYAPPAARAPPGSVGGELAALLRLSILSSPALCRNVPAASWSALLERWAAPSLRGPDPAGAAAVVAGILRRCGGGFSGAARDATRAGLRHACAAAGARADARSAAALLTASAAFLARCGLDGGRPASAALVHAASGVLAAAWVAAGRGDTRARDAAVGFLRVALAVGGLDAAGAASARTAVSAEVKRKGFDWVDRGGGVAPAATSTAPAAPPPPPLPPHADLPGPPFINAGAAPPLHVGPLVLGRAQAGLLALAAALEDAVCGGDPAAWGVAAGADAGGGEGLPPAPAPGPRPAKRARTAEAFPLPTHLADRPGLWAPLVCAVLRGRGRPPAAVARALLSTLAGVVRGGRGPRPPRAARPPPASQAARSADAAACTAAAVSATWVLRAVADLASYWPGGGEGGGGGGGPEDDVGDGEGPWTADAAPPAPGLVVVEAGGDASDGDDTDLDADWASVRTGSVPWGSDKPGRGFGSPADRAAAAECWAAVCEFAAAWLCAPGSGPRAPADAAALALAAASRAGLLPPGVAASHGRVLASPTLAGSGGVPSAAALALVASLGAADLSAPGPPTAAARTHLSPAAADAAARAAALDRILAPATLAAHPELAAAAAWAVMDGPEDAAALAEPARRAAAAAASAWAAPSGVAALNPGDGVWGSPADPATSSSDAIRAVALDTPDAADEEGDFLERALASEAVSAEERLRAAARAARVRSNPPAAPLPLRGTLPPRSAAELAFHAAACLTQSFAHVSAAAVAADAAGGGGLAHPLPTRATAAVHSVAAVHTTPDTPPPTVTTQHQAGHAVLDPLGGQRAADAARDVAAAGLFGCVAAAVRLMAAAESHGAGADLRWGGTGPLSEAVRSALVKTGPALVGVVARVGGPGGGATGDPVVDGGRGPALDRWAGLCGALGAGALPPSLASALIDATSRPFAAAALELSRLFVDADLAAAAAPAAAGGDVAAAAANGPAAAAAEAVALFDEELDAAAGAATPASRSPAVRATARRAACLRALAALAAGPPDPAHTAAGRLSSAIAACTSTAEGDKGALPPPPTALWVTALGSLVDAAVGGGGGGMGGGADPARDAALALAHNSEGDLLARGRSTCGGLAAATTAVALLADAWPRPPPGAAVRDVDAAKAAAAAALGPPLFACLAAADAAGDLEIADDDARTAPALPSRTRAALGTAAAAVLAAGGAGGWADGHPHADTAVNAALRPLGDVSYAVRRDGAPDAVRILSYYTARAAVFGEVVRRMGMGGGGGGGGREGGGELDGGLPPAILPPPRVETALAALASAARLDDEAELRALHLILASAAAAHGGPEPAAAEGVRRTAAAALRAAAAGLGYASRSAHLAWRLPDLAYRLAGVVDDGDRAEGGDDDHNLPPPSQADPRLPASALASAAAAAVGGSLTRPTEADAPSTPTAARQAAFLRNAAPALVAPYTLAAARRHSALERSSRRADRTAAAAGPDMSDLNALAATSTGGSVGRLLTRHWGPLLASVVPSSSTYGLAKRIHPDDRSADEAVGAVLNQGPVVVALPTEGDRDALFRDALPDAVVALLLRARAGAPGDGGLADGLGADQAGRTDWARPPPPLTQSALPPTAAAVAVRKLVASFLLVNDLDEGDGGEDARAAAAAAIAQAGLGGAVPLRALAVAEARVRAARAPRHRVAALGAVRATLSALGPGLAGGPAQAGAALALLCRAVVAGGADVAGPASALAGWVVSAAQAQAQAGSGEPHGLAAVFAALPPLVAAVVRVAAASPPSPTPPAVPFSPSLLPASWSMPPPSTTGDDAFSPSARAAGVADLTALAAALVTAAACAHPTSPAGAALAACGDAVPAGLPALEGLRAAVEAAAAARPGGPGAWADRLGRLAARAATAPPAACAEAARSLRAELAAIDRPWSAEEDGAVRSAAWSLVRLAAGSASGGGGGGGRTPASFDQAVDSLCALGAAILAEAGPFPAPTPSPLTAPGVDPVATAMLPGADLVVALRGGGAPASTSAADAATPPLAGDPVPPALASLLAMLVSRAADGLPGVALPAQRTLETLLSLPRGRAAAARLPPAIADAVAAFAPQAAAGRAGGGAPNDLRRGRYPPDAVTLHPAQSAVFWTPPTVAAAAADPAAVGRWARRLASALLACAAAPELRAAAPAAAASCAAAELLLPLALADAARRDPVGRAGGRDALSRDVRAALLTPAASPSDAPAPAAVRTLLTCLDHLRSVRTDAILARGPPPHPDAPSEGDDHDAAALAADAVDESAVDWPTSFWLDLPYLDVASAALAAGEPGAALLYAELEVEAAAAAEGAAATGGGGAPSPTTTAAPFPRLSPALASVLLAAHRSSPDPDGIYFAAAAAGGRADACLALFQLAGDWAAVAAAADAAVVRGGGPAASAAGLLPGALAHMGCRAALRTVCGLEGVRGAVGGGVADVAAEAAWRMGEWGTPGGGRGGGPPAQAPPSTAAPSSTSTPSFNASICACLAALEAGDVEGAGASLASARASAVSLPATAAPALRAAACAAAGGTSRADPAIVRLQMVANLEDAVGLAAAVAAGEGGAGAPASSPRRAPLPPGLRLLPPASDPLSATPALAELEARWTRREAAAFGPTRRDAAAYEAAEPLLALRRAVARALGARGAERRALVAAAAAARRAGAGPAALAALTDLRAPVEALEAAGVSPPPWLAPDTGPTAAWRTEEAKLLWSRGQAGAAVRALQAALDEEQEGRAAGGGGGAVASDPLWRPAATALLGKWLGATRAAGAPAALAALSAGAAAAAAAADASPSPASAAVVCRASFRLADFADGLARAAADRRATPDWAAARRVVEMKQAQLAAIQARQAARASEGRSPDDQEGRNLAHAADLLSKVIAADSADQGRLASQQAAWAAAALEHYRRALTAGSAYDLRALPRLLARFLEDGPADPAVLAAAAPALEAVPSHKFVPLLYQIASRLGSPSSPPPPAGPAGGRAPSPPSFPALVARLMARLAADHPHHTLWQLYALANGGRGRAGPGAAASTAGTAGPRRGSSRAAAAATRAASVPGLEAGADADKAAAAAAVSTAVARSSPSLARLVAQTSALGEAYIELAALPAARDAGRVTVPAALRRAAAACSDLPPASSALPVRTDADYASAPRFAGFGPVARFVGGINRPKLVTASDSAGAVFRELVKAGQDDPRQDACLQQAWCLASALLAANPASRARCLRVRTYRVLPLSPGVGVMQWVEATATLHDILVGPASAGGGGGVHARHAPRVVAVPPLGGRPARLCAPLGYVPAMNKLAAAVRAGDPALLRPTYDWVCAAFPPALRHWFTEAHRSPPAWHAARTAYTRSTAAASMVGYVLGLGDRHAHNILVDCASAEVIHIDLGVAFEQGRFLRVPETVPFRLTRDVVDGMGPAGVEGSFRRCCEAALAVLRDGRDAVGTVVGVLVHDPLYRWQLTPVKARRRQGGGGGGGGGGGEGTGADGGGGGDGAGGQPQPPAEEANADAARALLRVRQKLAGLDGSGGDGAPLSVEAQVRMLLHEAADPGRLARMYVGWAPFL